LKKFVLIFVSSIIGIVLLAWFIYNIYNKIELKKEKAVSYFLSNSEKDLIQDGDIVLRYGHGFVSDYIVKTFNEPFSISHCGIVTKSLNKLSVIHSESSSYLSEEGIQEQDFDEFVDAGHKNSVMIVRFNRCPENELYKISERAKYYLDKKIPFDYAFDPKDTEYMFCSEIIWHVFLDSFNKNIFLNQDGKTDFNQFRNFYNPEDFNVIINHQKDKKLVVF
jgi:hypothetical protein